MNITREITCPCEYQYIENDLPNEYDMVMDAVSEHSYPRVPQFATVEITNRCNLKCRHCCVLERRAERVDRKIFESLREWGVNEFEITGGEPLLSRSFYDIIEYLVSNSSQFRLISNGTLWNNRHYEVIKSYPKCEVLISLEGPPDIHDRIRGKGVHNLALATLRKLKSNNIHVGISVCMSRLNIQYLDYLYKLCCEYEINILKLIPLKTNNLDPSFRQYRLSNDEIHQLNNFKDNYPGLKLEYEMNAETSTPNLKAQFFGCKMGSISCSIDANGNMLRCPVSRESIGNLLSESPATVWNKLQVDVRTTGKDIRCRQCAWNSRCVGRCQYL